MTSIIKLAYDKNYICKAGLLINPRLEKAVPRQDIFISGGRIASVGGRESAARRAGPTREAVVFNLEHLAVLPPLVDCHVHLALDGKDFAAARRRWNSPGELFRQVQAELLDTVKHGILAVRDGGDRRGIALRFRNLVRKRDLVGPRILAPGYAMRKPGTYGSFLGPGVGMDEVEAALDGLAGRGADLVKVIVSGVVSFQEYGRVGAPQYSAGELAAIVAAARARGLAVMAHASSDEAVRLAVQAGVDSVEHGYFAGPDTLQLMAEKGVSWVPTVIPVAAQLHGRKKGGPGRQERYVLEKTVDRQLAMINEAAALGVTLGVGTDAGAAGVPHGCGYPEELALFRRAGLSPAQVLQCATWNGARILGLNLGSIEPGRAAALVAVEGNPLFDPGALHRVRYVFLPPQL